MVEILQLRHIPELSPFGADVLLTVGCYREIYSLNILTKGNQATCKLTIVLQQESEMNGVPSLTLPSISEDDENIPEEGETSPLSPPTRSPMHNAVSVSPRHAKFNSRFVVLSCFIATCHMLFNHRLSTA